MFETILKNNGWVKQWQENETGFHLFKNDTYLLMVYQWHNSTRVDPIATHDRWAIAEWEFDFVPYTQEDLNKIYKIINHKEL